MQKFNDLRLQYVLHEITETQWAQRIMRREVINARNRIIVDVISSFRTVAIEKFQELSKSVHDLQLETEEKDTEMHFTENGATHYKSLTWQQKIKYNDTKKKHKNAYDALICGFTSDMRTIRKFVNTTLRQGLSSDETKRKPLQIMGSWVWSDERRDARPLRRGSGRRLHRRIR